MRLHTALLAFSALVTISPAFAAAGLDDILKANQAATAQTTWKDKATLKTDYAYSGQGLAGKTQSLSDTRNGRWVDSYTIGPVTGANGHDGAHAWQKDQTGTVTQQDGGEAAPLAVNEGYRRANLWWKPDHGGAVVTLDPQKTDGGATYDVITVVPKNGKSFDAWFDTTTHLLSRTVEFQGPVAMTTTLSDYHDFVGVKLATKTVQSTGNAKYDQTLTLTGATFVAAQGTSAYAMPASKAADFTIAGGAHQVTFPFELVNNHIYASVKINGKGPYVFIFDTGGVNVVTPPLARALGIAVEGKTEARGGGEGSMEAGFVKVGAIDIGGAAINDTVFMSVPLDSMAHIEGREIPGMVGFETFRRFVTRIDYGAHTITLMDPKSFDAKDAGTPVKLVFDGNIPEVEGSYMGHGGKFMIDTGARSALMIAAPFADKNALRSGATHGVEAVTGWGVGGPTRALVYRGGELKIGDVSVTDTLTLLSTDKGGAMATMDLAGNIGGGILKQFVITFDYEHNTMYLKKLAGPIADFNTYDRAGMWLNKDPQGLTVVDVTAKAPAAEAGLKAGDIVTAVNGKPAADIVLPDLRLHLRNDKPGTVVTFTVRRDGASRDVKVTLRDLI